jgi:hypothetical protein
MEEIKMKKNVGNVDKTIRIILGIGIIVMGIGFQSWLGIIGVIPLITGIIGYCPLYSIFSISTCKISSGEKKE